VPAGTTVVEVVVVGRVVGVVEDVVDELVVDDVVVDEVVLLVDDVVGLVVVVVVSRYLALREEYASAPEVTDVIKRGRATAEATTANEARRCRDIGAESAPCVHS
jgi:hypothetical protein